jgi:hypothetical protein
VAGYQANYRAVPIVQTEIVVEFTPAEVRALRKLRGRIGSTDSEMVRAAFMLWYQQNRMKPHWVRPDGVLD